MVWGSCNACWRDLRDRVGILHSFVVQSSGFGWRWSINALAIRGADLGSIHMSKGTEYGGQDTRSINDMRIDPKSLSKVHHDVL